MIPTNWLWHAPLQTQLRTLLVAVAAPAVLLLSVFAVIRESTIIRTSFQEKCEGLVDLAAYNMGPGVEFEDRKALDEVITGLTRAGDVVYVTVTDPTERPLAVFPPGPLPWRNVAQANVQASVAVAPPPFATAPAGSPARPLVWQSPMIAPGREALQAGAILHLRTRLEFNRQTLGFLFIGFSLARIDQDLAFNFNLVVITVVLTLILIVVGARRFGRLITNPIESLKRTAENISSGNYSVPPLSGTAALEFEYLNRTFNAMVEAIHGHQQELRHLNQTLEQKVLERTRELEIQTRKAQQSERLKSEFLSNMSHELRTPLTSILAWPDLILDHYERKEEVLLGAAQIKKTAQHLQHLISELLDMEAIDTGRMRVKPVMIQPAPVMADVLQHLAGFARERDIRVIPPTGVDLPQVSLDPQRLKQVLINLVSNAIKFSPRSAEVALQATVVDRTMFFTVIDHGVGIGPDDLPFIFDRFRQIDGSLQRRFGGSGVGLYIVKNLVTMMGGTVEVESRLGHGSTFRVAFPLP